MSSTDDATARGTIVMDWALFGELVRALALKIRRAGVPETVVAAGTDGVIVGAALASLLGARFADGADDVGGDVMIVGGVCTRAELTERADRFGSNVRIAALVQHGGDPIDFHALATESAVALPWKNQAPERAS